MVEAREETGGNRGDPSWRFWQSGVSLRAGSDGKEPISVYFTVGREDFTATFETMLRAVGSRSEE